MATSGVLRAVLLLILGLTGIHAASLQISAGGEDVTDTDYFAQLGESVTFICKGGSNATWTVSSLAVPHSDQGNGLYQSSNNEGGQLLRVLSFSMEQVARYTCKADNSSQVYVKLEADILSNVTVLNSTAITVYWSTKPRTGLVQCCPDGKQCLTATVNRDLDNYVYSGLEEYTRYAVSFRGESRKVFIITYQDRPSAEPLNIRFFIDSSLHITISWELPVAEDRNGIITSYEINCIVTSSTESDIINETVYVENPRFDLPSELSYRIHAKHHSTYACRFSAATVNGSGPASMHNNVTVELPKLAISNNGDDSVVASWDTPHVSGVSSVQSSASLILATGGMKTNISVPVRKTEWTISNLVAGVPYEVKVEVGVSNIITASETKLFFTRELEPLEAVEGLSATAINATAIQVSWTDLPLNRARGIPVYTVHIESKASSWSNEVSAQSTPAIVSGLLPATQYTIQVKVTTAGSAGAGQISSSVTVETKSEGRTTEDPTDDGTAAPLVARVAVEVGVGTAVAVAVIVVGVLVALACLYMLWRSMRGRSYRNQVEEDGRVLFETGNSTPMSSPPAIRESVLFGDRFAQQLKEMQATSANRESYENTRPPVKVSDFPEYVQRMRVENSFNVEFEGMPKCDASACRSDADSETNKPKNRYQTIVPYNQSRVILLGQSNYINASYVDGYKRAKVYIATQGPLECTVSDFWQMVWEQKCSVIAMLTNLEEEGTAKCYKYWEDELTKPLQLPNGISVQQDEHKIFAEYECRLFTVTHRDHPDLPALTVHHCQYTAWPDYQVPKYPASLVRFVQTVRRVYKDEKTPMVVHCSAGVGRTGTFIAIDAMMQRMKERDDINIYEFLYEMRNCRMWLVMTVEQYEFIHEAVCDFAMSRDTYIDAREFDTVLARLKESSGRVGDTAIEEQFQLLDQLSRKPSKKDDIFAKQHMEDNRYETRYPYVSNHVVISKTGKNQYINAGPIDSYSKRHAFIAAEIPTPNKVELVLDIIAQKQCSTLVVLCTEEEVKEVSFCKFWPVEESASMSFGQYSLQLTAKYSKDGFTVLKITLMRTEGHEHHFTLIHIHGWTENNEPEPEPHAVWNAIQECEKAQKGITAPAVVMCNDGMGRTGAFICMCSEVERMKMEGMADIFQSVKAARNQRPYMVSTVDQYVLIHEVLMCFLKTFQIYDNFGRALARPDRV